MLGPNHRGTERTRRPDIEPYGQREEDVVEPFLEMDPDYLGIISA